MARIHDLVIYTNRVSLGTSLEGTETPKTADQTSEVNEQRNAQTVTRYMLQSAARVLLPRERVATCMRVPRLPQVEVWRSLQGAHFGGLCVCGCIWHCPVCAAKVSERRRVELWGGVKGWFAQDHGGHVLLVTFTLRHRDGQGLLNLVRVLNQAYKQLQQGAGWLAMKDRYGIEGTVRAFEVTHGVNGWHPHLHVLVFTQPGINLGRFTHDIKARWLMVVQRLGGDATWVHGCDVRSAREDVVDYVTKWGKEPTWTVAHELTKGVSKRGRRGGRTPMELLRDYTLSADQRAGELWRIYATAMSGARQLTWSRGLRDRLGLNEEKTDEEVATEKEEPAMLFATLTLHQWRLILANDLRAELLGLAAADDEAGLHALLLQLEAVAVPPVVKRPKRAEVVEQLVML